MLAQISNFIVDFLDFFYSRLDPKDLDVLLSEIVLLNTRAELYLRFVRRRLVVSYVNVTIFIIKSSVCLEALF